MKKLSQNVRETCPRSELEIADKGWGWWLALLSIYYVLFY